MDKAQTLDLFNKGASAWNSWAEDLLQRRPNLKDTSISGRANAQNWKNQATVDFARHTFDQEVNFSNFYFPYDVNFHGVVFKKAALFKKVKTFGKMDFGSCRFDNVSIFDEFESKGVCTFSRAIFNGPCVISNAEIQRIVFDDINLKDHSLMHDVIVWDGANFRGTNFHQTAYFGPNCSFTEADFGKSVFLDEVTFRTSDLTAATFQDANLEAASFLDVNLERAKFFGAKLQNAFFAQVRFDDETNFKGALVEKLNVNKAELHQLKEYGGLSVSDRMHMNIRDDAGELRMSFSGFQRWFHVSALITFATPYLWFLILRWQEAISANGIVESGIPIWKAFARFVYSGGETWRTTAAIHWSFSLFVIGILFNLLRVSMLSKTSELESKEHISNVPVLFSLQDKVQIFWFSTPATWGHFLALTKLGAYLFLAIAVINLLHFSTLQIPLSDQ